MVMLMDVEKLKKMNVLADTLKQHGLAATREDAADLAGDMVGTNDEQEFGKVFVPDEPTTEQELSPSVQEETPEATGYNEEQLKKILQSFASQFCDEINKLEEKINQQNTQIEAFKRAIDSTPEEPQPVEQPAVAEPQEPITQATAQEVPADVPQAAPAQASPRSGNYESSDVSIEKFFYCGQK